MTPRPAAQRPTQRHGRGLARSLGGRQPPPAGARIDPADQAPLTDPDPDDTRRWRYGAWPVIVAVVGGAGMFAGGVPPWRAVVIAVGAGLALWAVIVSFAVRRIDWYDDVPGFTYRSATPWEVPGLVGARESAEAFELYLRPRLWSLAQELLRRRGIEPDSARARELVGEREFAIFSGVDRDPRHTTASVSVLCQVIARLAVEPFPGSAPAIANPALKGLAGAAASRTSTTAPHPTEGPRP